MSDTIRVKKVTTITKFSIVYFGKHFDYNLVKKNNNLSEYFWNKIFDKSFLENFLLKYYLNLKKRGKEKNKYLEIEKEINFLLDKINFLKSKMDIVSGEKIMKGNDIFFSYRLFTTILSYVCDFFKDDKLSLGLREGIIFHNKNDSLKDLVNNINFYKNTNLIKLLVEPLVRKIVEKNKKIIYNFEIFWPSELILIGIISTIIKKISPESKIVVDLSSGNEQFDFTQWTKLLINADKTIFKYYDFFIVDRDFGFGINEIQKYLKGNIKKELVQNVIFFDGKIYFKKIDDDNLTKNIFEKFLKSTFNKYSSQILGAKSKYSRFLPYKCYWSKCNFCAINSQNKFSYDKKYSYDFFIDLWINYIKKYDIKSINFKDEAIPPMVIIKFASELIKNNLKVNYQFRTRFDKLYTYKNCKILADSGCGYCGIGLESAVERVNEKIGNKGNIGITLKDKVRIIYNFDKARISFHNYAIMGFPGESTKEALFTYNFLRNNIKRLNFYTCTPNIFGLMKGPKFFSKREELGIEIKDRDLKNPFNLIYEFRYKGKKRDLSSLKYYEEKLHKEQFLPWLKNNNYIKGREFWNYIDRSYIFYLLKRYHKKNTFFIYKDINKKVLSLDIKEVLNKKFKISNYFQLFEDKNNNFIYIYDWVGCKDTIINKKYKNLIKKYNNNISLLDNIKKNDIKISDTLLKDIYLLIKDRILIKNNKSN